MATICEKWAEVLRKVIYLPQILAGLNCITLGGVLQFAISLPSFTPLPLASCHEHDAHDINVAVAIEVAAQVVAGIPVFAMLAGGNLHDLPKGVRRRSSTGDF